MIMKKIILSTDFSDNALNAIDYALLLFEKTPCTFYLLHAFHDAPSEPTTIVTRKDDLSRLLKRTEAKNNNPNHHFEMVIETDSVVNLINRTAINNAVDYILMGTKGYSTLHEVFLGSNTVDVIKYLQCSCPIVAVPEDYDIHLPEEIVFASDYKHAFIAPEVDPLIAITDLCGAKLSVIHIDTEKELSEAQKENKEVLKKNLKTVKLEFREMKMKNSTASTLYHLEKENPKIGMVALLNTKHGFFQKLLREPIIRNMTFQTKVPLMVLAQIVD